MKIVCITHADFEGPGCIQNWAGTKGYDFKILKPYQGEQLSSVSDYDMFIVMGGPQSPRDQDHLPYLGQEIAWISDAIQQNKTVLGFCLGAQLIAEALGARTERSPEKEIGVYPILLTQAALADPLLAGLPSTFPAIHWHNDMPGLTAASQVLAYSQGCPRQIVRYGKRVYGFQCHLEITLEGIQTLIQAVPDDLKPSLFTQTEKELLAQDYASINQNMMQLLDRFVKVCVSSIFE